MFPLHQGDELCFQISSNPNQRHKIPQDLILAQVALHGNTHIPNNDEGINPRRASPRLVSMGIDETGRETSIGRDDRKKMMHRDLERVRRQEMTTLYASLRSLLPLEFIKGKRSMSDHMNEAVNYIKHLQRKLKQLDAKRDELKRLSSTFSVMASQEDSNNSSPGFVMVRPCLCGIEIVFTRGSKDIDLPLSRVLQLLLEEGLSVVNCVSTKANQSFCHTLQAEVNDPTCLNLSGLQRKLTLLVSSSD